MKKIIAKEVSPACVDFSSYFDGDAFTNAGGENCAIYIPPTSRMHRGFNAKDYAELVNDADNIMDEYNNGATITAACEYALNYSLFNTLKNNKHALYALKVWAEKANTRDAADLADYLSIITGEPWTVKTFTGYTQGDYCEVLYCENHNSAEGIKEFGNFWLGCGTEFVIDDCYGYFVLDTVRWAEGEPLRALLAEYADCNPEDLEVHLYAGEHTVTDYKIMEA